MTLRGKIEVMQGFERGEEIEVSYVKQDKWTSIYNPDWSWGAYNYRIKPKPKQVIVLDTWLIQSDSLGMFTIEGTKTYCSNYPGKIKLLSTREVEL